MAEFQQDPSANTGRFRAFVEQANETEPKAPAVSRGMLIGVGVALLVVIIVIVAVAV